MEEVGQQVTWGAEPVLVQEGPPLAALKRGAIRREWCCMLAQEDGATADDEAMA